MLDPNDELWVETSGLPQVGVIASAKADQANGSTQRYVKRAVFSVACGANAMAPTIVIVRAGGTTASPGTILGIGIMACPANDMRAYVLELDQGAMPRTTVVAEFQAAPPAAAFQAVTIIGRNRTA